MREKKKSILGLHTITIKPQLSAPLAFTITELEIAEIHAQLGALTMIDADLRTLL